MVAGQLQRAGLLRQVPALAHVWMLAIASLVGAALLLDRHQLRSIHAHVLQQRHHLAVGVRVLGGAREQPETADVGLENVGSGGREKEWESGSQ